MTLLDFNSSTKHNPVPPQPHDKAEIIKVSVVESSETDNFPFTARTVIAVSVKDFAWPMQYFMPRHCIWIAMEREL